MTDATSGDGPASAAMRLFDAAANRAGEGLRVAEDYLRFALDDRHLTSQCKFLRHELAAILASVPRSDRLAMRDTLQDVGRTLKTDSEAARSDLEDVSAAAWQRSQQALRSLEECAKVLCPNVAGRFEQLRYRAYTLERAAAITATSGDRLRDARFYVLIDGRSSEAEFAELVQGLVAVGVGVLQLRDKKLADRELLARARKLRELTCGTFTLCIINDRPDIAAASHADGVHVGQDELSVKDARAIVGPRALVGVSTHSIEQARQAVLDGANYIGVGPTFPSGTKQFDEFTGLELLRNVAAELRLPAFAIGGITRDNVEAVLGTGINRIAVSGAVMFDSVPANSARELLGKLVKADGDSAHR